MITPVKLREQIAHLSTILKRIDEVKAMALDLPDHFRLDLAKELRHAANDLIGSEQDSEDPHRHDDDSLTDQKLVAGNTRRKMMAFFRNRDNAPASVKEISDGTGATNGSITTILYKRNDDQFKRIAAKKDEATGTLWQLTASGIQYENEYGADDGDDAF